MKVKIVRDDILKVEVCDVCCVDKDGERFLISHTDPSAPKFNTFEWIPIVYCRPYVEVERPNKMDVKLLEEIEKLNENIEKLTRRVDFGFTDIGKSIEWHAPRVPNLL